MSIKFRVLAGGEFWVLGGGGSADFIFMGAGIFLIIECLPFVSRMCCTTGGSPNPEIAL